MFGINVCKTIKKKKIYINYSTFFLGYVCERTAVLPGGCCDSNAAQTARYSCYSCQENHCCEIYEYCVSCCLQPGKVSLHFCFSIS